MVDDRLPLEYTIFLVSQAQFRVGCTRLQAIRIAAEPHKTYVELHAWFVKKLVIPKTNTVDQILSEGELIL